ncbi:putative bifunctional diguanylate cyclase/phosphodiesterase [Rossellomorea aquimaris]|uniref:putative bifunctional diguanylate cyclase/phosphodiesterase n=1 Tax=Rossellomorea aquimaris TaxID=189382 RepID=UPI000697CC48|nr:bifunctional diguanylate cyclase/phosphodiesterase [Rossellomorea aquimaris]
MFFIFSLLVALIPFSIGITVLLLFKKSKLSKVLFLFLLLASFWQVDVALLFAYGVLSQETIDLYFRLFRIGSILVSPTLYYVAYTIYQEEFPNFKRSKWRFVMNKYSVLFFYIWSFIVYLVGWSKHGIDKLILIKPKGSFEFYFPIYGELSWVFHTNVFLFGLSMILSFFISTRIHHSALRSFLFHFLLSTAVGYGIGILNMFPESRLLPSAISVMVFAISILILSNRMHVAIVRDMNKQLDEQRLFLRTVIDLNPNYIYAKDKDGRYSLVNGSYAGLYGLTKEEMIGKTDFDVQLDKEMANNTFHNDKAILSELKGVSIPEEEFINKDGNVMWLQTTKIPIVSGDDTILLGVSTDITQRKRHEDELIHQANHDVLTGLPNRRLFNEDLTTVLMDHTTHNISAAIMLIDLDRFKYINDTLGHDFGDLLLIEVSRRLEKFLEINQLSNAKVYRQGGDEFTFLFPDFSRGKATETAKLLIEQFSEEFVIKGQEFYITPSIGISMYPEDGQDAKTLMKNADTAMYYVKDREKNSFQLFTKEMNQQFYRKMVIEKELRSALDKEEFHLVYQPFLNVKTGSICGMEALIRWKSKTLGNVSPVEFISIAEETGLIIPIGQWVIDHALKQIQQWKEAGYKELKVSVNISIRQLMDKSFVGKVEESIKKYNIKPAYIDFEVTESIAMCDQEVMISKLQELKGLGVSLSMDDFGTGYSSLSYLKKYPLDTLKIDRSFIRGITSHQDHQAIVKSTISMAKHLHLNVTAEGVESREEYHFLKSSNCDMVQGYGIGHPMPPEEFEKNVFKENSLPEWL